MNRFFVYFLLLIIGFFPANIFCQYLSITKVGEWGEGYYKDVVVKGNYAYYAIWGEGLGIVDVSNPSIPKKIGNFDTPGKAHAVYLRGNYVYVADGKEGLQVIDVSNPSEPVRIGNCNVGRDMSGVIVDGNYAYVYGEDMLHIIDVSRPFAPFMVGYHWKSNLRDVYVRGKYAYLVNHIYYGSAEIENSKFTVLDISNPTAPKVMGCYETEFSLMNAVNLSGNYAYVLDSWSGLVVFDIADPSNPRRVGSTKTFGDSIYVDGDYAYVLCHVGGLTVFDISEPSKPKHVGEYNKLENSLRIYIEGNYAYLASGPCGIQILDVSRPFAPTKVGKHDFSRSANLYTVYGSGNYAYTGDSRHGFQVFNISEPSSPVLVGHYGAFSCRYEIHVSGNYAYLASGRCGLRVLDVSNPSTPLLSGSFQTTGNKIVGVYTMDNYAYIACMSGGLTVLDVSDPSSPVPVGNYDTPGKAKAVYVNGNYAYVADGEDGLQVIDISRSSQPSLAGNVDSIGDAYDVAVSGNYAYVLSRPDDLQVIDVSDPSKPFLAEAFDLTGSGAGCKIYVSDPYAYVGYVNFSKKGLWVIDISNPCAPALMGDYETLGCPYGVYVSGNYVYLAAGKLLVLKMSTSAVPPQIVVNRQNIRFASDNSGGATGAQAFLISNSGGGDLNWSVSAHQNWLYCSPSSGKNNGQVFVSVKTEKLSPGIYMGTIKVSDSLIDIPPGNIKVALTVYASGQASQPFGEFVTPIDGSIVSGSIPVTGWALADAGILGVKIFSIFGNGKAYIGDAVLVEGARPDIEQAYPQYPDREKAGWGYMLLTNLLPNQGNGSYIIQATAVDYLGYETILGNRNIIVDNVNAVNPFGAIDTPAQGGTASGSAYRNHGWVLTPPPNAIPTDGSTINVYIDGVDMGHASYNFYRSDIAELFPGYANSSGAHAYFDLDTTAYENGVHTIYWTAADDAGNTDGIGSRYFLIQNSQGAGSREQGAGSIKSMEHGAWSMEKSVTCLEPVGIIKGYARGMELQTVYPDHNGIINISIEQLERLEIQLGDLNSSSIYSGYQLVGDQFKSLPIGSTLDMEEGIFYWQAGHAFIGEYWFVFLEKRQNGVMIRKNMKVTIHPKYHY